MANNNLIDHYSQRALMEATEILKIPDTFLMKNLVNNVDEFASETVDLDIYKGNRKTAAYVQRYEQGQVVNAVGYSTKSFKPAYLKPKTLITPGDLQKRSIGGQIYDNSGNLQAAVAKLVANRTDELGNIISKNEEYQVMQALTTGKVTCHDINGVALAEIDYGRDSTLTYQVGTLWSAAAQPLADVMAARLKIKKLSNLVPRTVILGNDAAAKFLNSDSVQKSLSRDWSNRGMLNFDIRDDGGIWLGTADGADFWQYPAWIVNPATGVEEEMIPSKKMLIISESARLSAVYGSIAAQVNGQFITDATSRFIDMWGEKDPAATIIQVHSAPLIVTNVPDAYALVTVLV